jgi:DNA-binding beta-propeller fold protein YncE
MAFAPGVGKLFVSDESGEAEAVIDPRAAVLLSTIRLGGEAGNTQYDAVSGCILVAVQTRNELVAIDPLSERILQHYPVPGSDHPHGFVLDEPGRLAFISSEANATLQVLDLRTMQVVAQHPVGSGPDVLAWDPGWRRLYVASEGGVVSSFAVDGTVLHALPEYRAPHAHTIAVDPRTHRVYLPLEDIGGRPLLRVLLAGQR